MASPLGPDSVAAELGEEVAEAFSPSPPAGPRESWDRRLWGGTVPIVTLISVLTSAYLWLTGHELPVELIGLDSTLVGYWIRGGVSR